MPTLDGTDWMCCIDVYSTPHLVSSMDSLVWQFLCGELVWDVPGGMQANMSIPISLAEAAKS